MGPLDGVRIVEFGGIGPGPVAGMVLADLGAEVILVERKTATGSAGGVDMLGLGDCAIYNRGKRSIAVDLKKPGGVDCVLRLIDTADGLIEGFRPGVMERLGLGPEVCLQRNPKLVYGRMTGWGQYGPLAQSAGHDLNYIALSGALSLGRRRGAKPWAPPALLGDMGGGAMFLALGIVSGVLHARTSGEGQVVDAAITDGTALLAQVFFAMKGAGILTKEPDSNPLGGEAYWYDSYECADGEYVTVSALEPPFHQELLQRCGVDDPGVGSQLDRSRWPELKKKFAALFKTRTRAEWCELLEGSDACFAPVLDLDEAPEHPHNVARETFVCVDGVVQAAPAPRFSVTHATHPGSPPANGEHTEEILAQAGFSADEIAALRSDGAL